MFGRTLFRLILIQSLIFHASHSWALQAPVEYIIAENNIAYGPCTTEALIKQNIEICQHPESGTSTFVMNLGPYVRAELPLTLNPLTIRKLTCSYCRAGSGNGPTRAYADDTRNVVPIGRSFLVTGSALGESGYCEPPLSGKPVAACMSAADGRPTLPGQCLAQCKGTWQNQVVRVTCLRYEDRNFDGDPECGQILAQ